MNVYGYSSMAFNGQLSCFRATSHVFFVFVDVHETTWTCICQANMFDDYIVIYLRMQRVSRIYMHAGMLGFAYIQLIICHYESCGYHGPRTQAHSRIMSDQNGQTGGQAGGRTDGRTDR